MSESQEFNPYLVNEAQKEVVDEKITIDSSELYPAEEAQSQELTLQQILFSPEGRLSRWTFFKYSVLSLVLWMVLLNIAMAISEVLGLVFAVAAGLVLFYSQIVLQVKRWHDMDKPGSSVIMNFLPIICIYAQIKVYLTKGTEGRNEFGLEEKGGRLIPDEYEKGKLDFIAGL